MSRLSEICRNRDITFRTQAPLTVAGIFSHTGDTMFSRNASPRLRRISHAPSSIHTLQLGIFRLSRLFGYRVHRHRLWPLAAPGLFGCAFAPSSKVTGADGCRVRTNRNRSLGSVCACTLTILLSIGLTGCDYQVKAVLVGLSPLAGVKAPLNFVPLPDSLFDGNSTTVGNDASDSSAASVGFPGTLLARTSDCSVAAITYSNYKLTSGSYSGAFSGTFTATVTPNYSTTLHNLAGLTTKAGVYANGCTDKTSGINGLAAVLLAHTSVGKYVTAGLDLNSNLYIGAADPAGTVSGARLSLTNIFTLYAGDPNSEGVRQLIAFGGVNLPSGGFSDALYTINVHADGTYDAPVTLTPPSFFSGVVIDDFNGDGIADIGFTPVVGQANSTALPFTVLPGKGGGAFGAAIVSVTPTNILGNANNAVTGDFNGDGKRDILTGASILLGVGDGTFTLSPNTPPAGVTAVGDLNGDGKDDLVVVSGGSGGSSISIYLGKGDGTFTATGPSYASIYGGTSVAISDIDGDGHLDLVVGLASNGIYVPPQFGQGFTMFLMGNGDGTFRGAPVYPHAAGSGIHGAFAAGDFNNDGNIDVLTTTSDNGGITTGLQLLLGNGKGTLTPQTSNTSVVPSFVAAADINGDGKLDAVTLASTTDNSGNVNLALVTLKGNGDGTFATPVSYPVGTPSPNGFFPDLALGDTRATGKPDAVLYENGALYLLENNGDGTFATPVLVDTENDFQALAVADVNGDGKADIVALTSTPVDPITTTNSLLVYLSQGNGTFASPVTLAASLTDVADMIVADVNKDGKPDIVLLTSNSNTGASSLTSYLGHGDGTFAAGVNSTVVGLGPDSLATADVNGDGNLDMLIGACCGYTLASISYGNGDGTFTANAGLSIGPSTNAVGFADLNNDGRPDLLLATNKNLVTSLNEFGSASTTLAPTTTTLTLSPAAPTAGQSVTFSATVAPTTGSGTPTGTVTFLDGTTTLGTGTLSAGTASFTGSLAAGTHSITASYGGDTAYAASVSAADNLTIGSAPTLAVTTTQLTASSTNAVAGTSINFKASVSETSGTTTPTGTVTFSDGSTSIGTGSLTAGVATFSTASLSVGTHNITAAYGGDTANATSSSSVLVITITAAPAADFTIALSPSTGSVSPGSSATSTITITPSGGFSQAISLACSGLPANSTCTFSPTSVTPNGTGTSTSTLTIATDVKTASLSTKPLRTPGGATSLAMLAGGGSLGLLLLRRRRKDRRLWLLQMSLVAAFVFTSAMIGCGHGASATTTTPAGTSQITITATAGSTVHTAKYSLTVQ